MMDSGLTYGVDDETPLLLGVSFALQEIIIKETLLFPAVFRLISASHSLESDALVIERIPF